MDKEELWKCEYLQHPISYLTEENLDWLEQHCEKQIRYTTRNTLKEHLMVLELIKDHKQYLSMRADYFRRMKASNKVLRKQGYISKDKIKEKLELLKDILKAKEKDGNIYKQIPIEYLKGAIEQLEELLEGKNEQI